LPTGLLVDCQRPAPDAGGRNHRGNCQARRPAVAVVATIGSPTKSSNSVR
jgi:hypothetical protein